MPVRRRPSIFSYFSFGSASARNGHDRSDSISANLRPSDTLKPAARRNSEEMNSSARSRLIKLVMLCGAIFFLIFWLGPRDTRETVTTYVKEHAKVVPARPAQVGQTALDETTGTTKCKSSVSLTKPVVQYVLMVDAGSTGSRIHVYRFNNCQDMPELEDETFKETRPGLSSYPDNPDAAAKSLDMLLEVAMEKVPVKLRGCTPIAVKATAGLRLLGPEKSKAILDAVRHRLETKYPFSVVAGDGVQIMEGKDEGVFAWITTNFLLGKIGSVADTPTAAVFDLGGASTQIVFQPTFGMLGGGMPEKLAAGDHKYELQFGGRFFELYQHSHLGYGLMEARKAIHQAVYDAQAKNGLVGEDSPIINPCIAPGMSRVVEVKVGEQVKKVTMKGPAEASATECRGIAERILHKEKACTVMPCSFNGIHQPSFERTFAKEDVYVFSYFYDRVAPIGLPSSFTIKEMRDITAKVCGGELSWSSFSSTAGALDELRDRPEHCLDMSFMVALLHTGYEMPIDRELKTAKKIKGNELGWCLGASLPLLDQGKGGWHCRLHEIS